MLTLDEELGKYRSEIRTDRWSASVGELFSLYTQEKLEINPVFQRFFRWDDEQKSLLVESILLGFPIPPLFFAQNEDGVLEVVDGVQRLSTLLQLSGKLRGESGELKEPLLLTSGQYLKSLEGRAWDEHCADQIDGRFALNGVLTAGQRSDIEFARLDAEIIQRSSVEQSKYDVFRRLNSYGEPLSPQETRAALIASESGDCLKWLGELARDPDTAEILALSDRQLDRQYDIELILRFFFLVETEELIQSSLASFSKILDDYGVGIARDFGGDRTDRLGECFVETIELIQDTVGAKLFRRYYREEDAFRGPFLNTSFEALGTSVGYSIFRELPVRLDLEAAAKEFWGHEELQSRFATGRNTGWRLSTYVPIGRQLVLAR